MTRPSCSSSAFLSRKHSQRERQLAEDPARILGAEGSADFSKPVRSGVSYEGRSNRMQIPCILRPNPSTSMGPVRSRLTVPVISKTSGNSILIEMSSSLRNNLLANLPGELPEEIFETVLQTQQIKIERIISKGQKSEEGFWYDQDQAEWVLVLKGQAQLEFEEEIIKLTAGDYLNIEAHQKHRVKWTTPDEETIWLAVFYPSTKLKP